VLAGWGLPQFLHCLSSHLVDGQVGVRFDDKRLHAEGRAVVNSKRHGLNINLVYKNAVCCPVSHLVDGQVGVRADDCAATEVHTLP
jgi:hypothetical protein